MIADSTYTIEVNPQRYIPCDFQQYLFNQSFHIQKQPFKQAYTFYLIQQKKQQAYARFTLFVQEEKGISPFRGPFGSMEVNPCLPVQHLDDFIQYIHSFAAKIGVRQIEIKSYPFCYHQEVSAILTASLLRQQYQILHTDLNYHIPVSKTEFTKGLHHSEKRRLQKCINQGFAFGEEQEPDLPLIYQIIVNSRLQKGYPITMNFNDFQQLFVDFPGKYKIFSVKDDQQIVAVTVAVQINRDILYYFLPAHDPAYNAFSPMVYLIQGLYTYCQKSGYSLLDLGISTDKGEPNYGLMRFKQNLGASVSLKLSFILRILH